MQLQETTTVQWESVIADLTAKRQSALTQLEQLRAEKRTLALDAAMGNEEAKHRLSEVNAEINRLALEVDDFDIALQRANSEKQKAADHAAIEAEQKRQRELQEAVRQYYSHVKEIDELLQTLANRFATAKEALHRAEAFMNSEERVPIQQLHSLWGATLACAFYGLDRSISFGREAQHVIHRQPLARYTFSFVNRWIAPGADPPPGDSEFQHNGKEGN